MWAKGAAGADLRKKGIPHSRLQAREGVPVHLLREGEQSAENIKRKKNTNQKKRKKRASSVGVWDNASQNKMCGIMSQNQAGKGTERGSVPSALRSSP